MGSYNVCRFSYFLRRFKLSFSVDNFSSSFTFGFGFFGKSSLHLLRQINVFHLDVSYFNSPRLRLIIDHFLKLIIYRFSISK